MIEKIGSNSLSLSLLSSCFPDVLDIDKTKYDMDNNVFSNYYSYFIDEKYVAFINYDVMYERAELININVLELYQNRKIASTLIEYMINDCLNKGVLNITLEVRIDNLNAIHLYKKFGFKEISIRKGYYDGIDAILMEKELM